MIFLGFVLALIPEGSRVGVAPVSSWPSLFVGQVVRTLRHDPLYIPPVTRADHAIHCSKPSDLP